MRNAKVHTEISDLTKSWQICAQFQRSRSLEETQMRLLGFFSEGISAGDFGSQTIDILKRCCFLFFDQFSELVSVSSYCICQ